MNTFDIEILEDGKVSIKSGSFGDTVHANADDLLKEIEEMLGGDIVLDKNDEIEAVKKIGAKAASNFWNKKSLRSKGTVKAG